MSLLSLDVRDFRNIQTANLQFSAGLNLITGPNAAGKTSLLEAIYCLGRVRSFRTVNAIEPVHYGKNAYCLVGNVQQPQGRVVTVGIERSGTGLRVHLDGRPISRLSELAGALPVQILSGDTQGILEGGPGCRRQAIDWGLFHVEHSYREYWTRYMRALRQRNAALRSRLSRAQVQAWDSELEFTGQEIHRLRQAYFEVLQTNLRVVMTELLPGVSVVLQYRRGWPADQQLAETLYGSLDGDRNRGYTRYGIQRADFKIMVDERDSLSHCSRGQKKVLTVGYMLAQLALQQERNVVLGAFLLDDFASELDDEHQACVLSALRQLQAQVFVTAIEGISTECIAWEEIQRFHVERGKIQEVV